MANGYDDLIKLLEDYRKWKIRSVTFSEYGYPASLTLRATDELQELDARCEQLLAWAPTPE